jgi:hypothetical protein
MLVQPAGITSAAFRHTEYSRTVLQLLASDQGNGFSWAGPVLPAVG